jgi:hypothetical protein
MSNIGRPGAVERVLFLLESLILSSPDFIQLPGELSWVGQGLECYVAALMQKENKTQTGQNAQMRYNK